MQIPVAIPGFDRGKSPWPRNLTDLGGTAMDVIQATSVGNYEPAVGSSGTPRSAEGASFAQVLQQAVEESEGSRETRSAGGPVLTSSPALLEAEAPQAAASAAEAATQESDFMVFLEKLNALIEAVKDLVAYFKELLEAASADRPPESAAVVSETPEASTPWAPTPSGTQESGTPADAEPQPAAAYAEAVSSGASEEAIDSFMEDVLKKS